MQIYGFTNSQWDFLGPVIDWTRITNAAHSSDRSEARNYGKLRRVSPRFARWLASRQRRVRRISRRREITKPSSVKKTVYQPFYYIDPPSVMCLDRNAAGVIQMLEEMRRVAHLRNYSRSAPKAHLLLPRVRIRFEEIETITASAALAIAAEYDRLRRITGATIRAMDYDAWNQDVRRTLSDLGFLDLLRVNAPEAAVSDVHHPKFILKFVTNSGAQGDQATELRDSLNEILQRFYQETLSEPENLAVFDGLVEAMTNVAHHAYPEDFDWQYQPVPGAWWMTGSVSSDRRIATIVFLDQGISIPGSLPRSGIGERVRNVLTELTSPLPKAVHFTDDALQIRAAMQVSRTSTTKVGRGFGLSDISRVIANCKNGKLRILSRKGEFIMRKDGTFETIEHDHSIGGTLIEWQIEI